ncbi:MAG TPA: TIGR03089 family protein [Pseudonocardiaceae bacterium]|nr:TIGR03089 family protein [Pseudonocardiaceae bacterium]
MSLTEKLFRPLLGLPARPLITQYDDADGSRVELSRATVANWAAKTANWLRDECDVEPGMPVSVALPAHWQTVGVLLGAWWCGARVVTEPAGAAVAFVAPEAKAEGAELVAAVALDPLGRGLTGEPPAGILDYLNEIRVFGDDFQPWQPVSGDTLALADYTVDHAIAEAQTRAAHHNFTADSRIMSTMDWADPDAVLTGLLSVLSSGAALVQCAHPDQTKLAARAETERTTHTLP